MIADQQFIEVLRRQARPMRWALLATAAASAVEVYALSRLGTDALAAFSLVLPALLAADALGVGLGAGAAALLLRQHGARTVAALGSLMVVAGVSFALALVGWLLLQQLPAGAAASTGPAHSYLRVWLWGAPLLICNATACALLRAGGRTRQAALVVAASAAASVALAPLLTLGGLGLAGWGLTGAATAQVMAAALGTGVLLILLAGSARLRIRQRWRLSDLAGTASTLLRVGLPASAANLLTPIGAWCLIQLLWRHGEGYAAAYSLALRLETLYLVPFLAYSSVAGPVFVEWLRSAAPAPGLPSPAVACRRFFLLRGALLAALLAPAPLVLPLVFSSCPQLFPALSAYVLLVPLSYGAYGLVMNYNAIFNCVGAPGIGLGVAALRCLLLAVPLAWLFSHFMGGTGVFLASAISNSTAAGIACRLLRWPRIAPAGSGHVGDLPVATPDAPRLDLAKLKLTG